MLGKVPTSARLLSRATSPAPELPSLAPARTEPEQPKDKRTFMHSLSWVRATPDEGRPRVVSQIASSFLLSTGLRTCQYRLWPSSVAKNFTEPRDSS